jgi:diacylglycerol O-acyltransferase / wax synthase
VRSRRWWCHSPGRTAGGLNILGPRTPFNVAITNQRSWAARSVPLAEAKLIAKRTGCTLNDVVLATCSGAMRKYLRDYEALPAKSMSAAIPVSLREAGDTSSDNQVSMMLMSLASDVRDPLERLRAIAAGSRDAKSMMGAAIAALPLDFPLLGAPWLMSGLASLFGRSRIANVLPPLANVVISNVPGPQTPLYFAGAKMLTYYPVSIPAHGMALNITVHSYDGDLDYGLIACRRAVPDIGDLADELVAEHRRLLAAAQAIEVEQAAPQPAAELKTESKTEENTEAKAKSAGKSAAAKTTTRKRRGPGSTAVH